MAKPPISATLVWESDLRFTATSAGVSMITDGDSAAGPSPVQALAISLAACMAMDVVSILTKGRQPLAGLEVTFTGERAPETPHRFLRIDLNFNVRGGATESAVDRAIALSREKYCSVWHSMRQDIEFTTSFEVHP